MKTAKDLFETVTINHSSCNISGVLDLFTPEDMSKEQEGWHEEDDQKNTDFSKSPAWLWGDGYCIGIDSAEELEQYL